MPENGGGRKKKLTCWRSTRASRCCWCWQERELQPSDSSNSGVRPTNQRFANGVEDLFVGREKDKSFVGDDLVADAHRKFAEIAFDQFGRHSEFAFQFGRHPGGSGFERCSGFAVTDDHAFHGEL